MIKKGISEGFRGEKILEVPRSVISACQKNALIAGLYITRMGFYPRAANHYFQRPGGIAQTILLYCTDGRGWIAHHNKKIELSANELFMLPAGIPHSYGSDAKAPWSIYWMHIAGKSCNEMAHTIMSSGMDSPVKIVYSEARIRLFYKMLDGVFNGFTTSNILFANLSLPHFLASFIAPENFSDKQPEMKMGSATEKAMLYIQQHYSEEVVLDDIARAAGRSVSFFSRKFRSDTGYSPVGYLNYIRIQKACQLLHFTDIRVNELAFKVGFNDPFYFSRYFRKHIGISPFQYRKRDGYIR
jgi:AraC family transcriptional regulator of arabinose operon